MASDTPQRCCTAPPQGMTRETLSRQASLPDFLQIINRLPLGRSFGHRACRLANTATGQTALSVLKKFIATPKRQGSVLLDGTLTENVLPKSCSHSTKPMNLGPAHPHKHPSTHPYACAHHTHTPHCCQGYRARYQHTHNAAKATEHGPSTSSPKRMRPNIHTPTAGIWV